MTQAALIAAIYAAATLVLAPFSFGPVQLRVSEALTLLPMLTESAVPGVALGCLLANAIGISLGQTIPVDLLFGTLATLLGAVLTRSLRNKTKIKNVSVLSVLSPIVCNALIVGTELTLFFGGGTFLYCAGFVALGEAAAVLLLGIPLTLALRRVKLFDADDEERKMAK